MELSCENTVDAVSNMLYGIRIEGYISLNMDSIKILNHLAGGVPVTIEDDFSQSDSSLVMGQNITLTDDQAMHYVHDRMNVGDGTNECRMRRQKAYVDALFPLYKAKLQADSGFVNEFYNNLSDYMVTDMSVGEMGNVANMIMNSEDKGELSIKGTNAIAEDDGFNEFTKNIMVENMPGYAIEDIGPVYTQNAINTLIPGFGGAFVAIALFFFAFTTLMAYYYIAEVNLTYLVKKFTGGKSSKLSINCLRIALLAMTAFGCIKSAGLAWTMGDIGVAMMAWLNLIAILALSKKALLCFNDYESQLKAGVPRDEISFDPIRLGIKVLIFGNKNIITKLNS